MQNNRQIPVDRNESNPMLMGLLELVKEDSQELQKCQKELNEAMGSDAEVSELMKQHKESLTKLQMSQQSKMSELMEANEAIKELVEQHKKELAELQLRQRQAVEKVMSEDPAIVEAMKEQRDALNALRMQHQQELNQQLNSSEALADVVDSVKEARKAMVERQQMFDREMFKAVYMSPVKITPEPTKDEEGNVKIAEGSKISIQVLPLKNGETGIMMAFTDAKEFQKWDKSEGLHTVSMTMQEYIGNIMRDPKLAGVVINPFGANIIIPRERIEMMMKAASINQKQAEMANQKNVEIVEADINE